jgi:erythromycin esterase-like protein
VWAHNAHVGDSRATQLGRAGDVNMGQLVRKRAGPAAAMLVGFTSSIGHVTAAHGWAGEPERMALRPARTDSYEGLFRRTGLGRFYLSLHEASPQVLHTPMLQRSIGVLYRPDEEFESHYFSTSLAQQFDALFHLDETGALEPLSSSWPNDYGDPGYVPMRPWR